LTFTGKPLGRSSRADRGGEKERSARSVRSAAVSVVERTLASRAPVDSELAAAAAGFDERDQALLRELVYGTLRWLKRLDQVVTKASGRTFEQIQPNLLPILRVAAYQLLFLDRVPAHAVVDEAVEEARRRSHKGAVGFVNAVLRRLAAQPDLAAWPVAGSEGSDLVQRLAVETSHPEILVRRWLAQFGELSTRELLATNNRPKPMHLLAFESKGGRAQLAATLRSEGVETEPSTLSPLGLVVRSGAPLRSAAFGRGEFYVQDEAAQLAALLPEPRTGERVLDVAAAPGGKGLALVAANPGVRLVAADLSLARLAALVENHRRLGSPAAIVAASAQLPPFAAAFDRVVVDYPCTGTGTLRKHPELKWRWSPSELDRLSRQATRLLAGAATAVAPHGVLVAISCSLEPEENELVGERFLASSAGFRRAALTGRVPEAAGRAKSGEGIWRFLPAADHDGFTVQVFERRS
jgi:16S rRNA (cytosine967-C5)-methyltransferase